MLPELENIKERIFLAFFLISIILFTQIIFIFNLNVSRWNLSSPVTIINESNSDLLYIENENLFNNRNKEFVFKIKSNDSKISDYLHSAKWFIVGTDIKGSGTEIRISRPSMNNKELTIAIQVDLGYKRYQLFDTISTYSNIYDFPKETTCYA